MELKALFDQAENGTLTYEQLVALMTNNKAKFVDLSEGKYVDKQKYADDISARDTRISTLDDTLKARDNDLANLQTQLANAGTDATKLTDLTNNFSELQKKYDKATKDYEKQLRDQAYKHAVNDFANQQKFTSQAARRDFVSSLLSKNLTLEGDTIVGASDFVTAYARDNSDAFAVESPTKEQKPNPHFVDSTAGTNNQSSDETPFKFSFTGVRPH